MGRTSIKNQLILSFLGLLLIVMVVVGVVNRMANDFYLAQTISAALALTAGIIFGNIFSRSIVGRLNNLSNVARQISRGDLSNEVPLLSKDELRDLEEVFTSMVEDLRGMISEMTNVSEKIRQTNLSLSDLVKKVLGNSEEINESARVIAKGSEEQSLIVQKMSISMENGLNAMGEMLRQSTETFSKISEARLKAGAGESKAHEILNNLDGVLKQMEKNTEPMFRLASKVEKIKLVINIMDEIAQKTDLLSLNASIEATRAGESGRGFALLADEIRGMADNSKRSGEEIRQMMEDILEGNKAVVLSISKSQTDISKGREVIHDIVNTFGGMLAAVKEISNAIKEIEQVTGKQVKQVMGLLNHFQELSRYANENFVSTQKTTVATMRQKEDMKKMVESMKSLNVLSRKMMETQQRFKL